MEKRCAYWRAGWFLQAGFPGGLTAFPGGMTALLDHRAQIFFSGPHGVFRGQENSVEIRPDPCSVGTLTRIQKRWPPSGSVQLPANGGLLSKSMCYDPTRPETGRYKPMIRRLRNFPWGPADHISPLWSNNSYFAPKNEFKFP